MKKHLFLLSFLFASFVGFSQSACDNWNAVKGKSESDFKDIKRLKIYWSKRCACESGQITGGTWDYTVKLVNENFRMYHQRRDKFPNQYNYDGPLVPDREININECNSDNNLNINNQGNTNCGTKVFTSEQDPQNYANAFMLAQCQCKEGVPFEADAKKLEAQMKINYENIKNYYGSSFNLSQLRVMSWKECPILQFGQDNNTNVTRPRTNLIYTGYETKGERFRDEYIKTFSEPSTFNAYAAGMNVKRMGEAMVKNLASNLDQLTTLVETSDPAVLLQDFNQKVGQIETLEANFNKQYNSYSFQTGQNIGNSINSGNYESAINQGLGFVNAALERKEAKKRLEAQKQALYQQRLNQMSKIYWKAVDFNTQAKAQYLQRAAFSTDLAEEKYNMGFVENLDCHSRSMKAGFSSSHTRWLANNCALPTKKQVLIMVDPNQAKEAKFIKLAEQKYKKYLESGNQYTAPQYFQFRDAAIHFTAKSISIKPTAKKYLSLAKYYKGVSDIYELSAYLSAEGRDKNSLSKEQKERVEFLKSSLAQQIKNAIYESDEEFVLSFMKSGFDKLFRPDGQDILDFAIKYDRSDLVPAIINTKTKKGDFKGQQALLKRAVMLSIANDSHQTLNALLDAGMTLEFSLNNTSPIELMKKVGALRCLTTYLRSTKKYDEVSHFYQGVAVVKKGVLYGLINTDGKEIGPLEYTSIRSPKNGLIVCSNSNYKFGALNLKGEVVIDFNNDYVYLGDLSFNKLLVIKENKMGYIDSSGKEVIPCIYDYAEDFGENYAVVGNNLKKIKRFVLIDHEGNQVIEKKYTRITNLNKDFVELGTHYSMFQSKDYLFPDKTIYFSHRPKNSNAYEIKKGKKFYVEKQSNVFTIVEDIKSKTNSIYFKDKEIFTYNPEDYDLVQIRYDMVKLVNKNGNNFLISSNGDKLNIDPNRNYYNTSNGLIGFNKSNNQDIYISKPIEGFIGNNSQNEIDVSKLKLGYPKNYQIVVEDNTFDKTLKRDMKNSYLQKLGIQKGPSRSDKILWGYVDKDLNWVIPPIYEKATDFNHGYAFAHRGDNKVELIDYKGRVLKSFEWKLTSFSTLPKPFNDGVALLKEGKFLDLFARENFNRFLYSNSMATYNGKGVFEIDPTNPFKTKWLWLWLY